MKLKELYDQASSFLQKRDLSLTRAFYRGQSRDWELLPSIKRPNIKISEKDALFLALKNEQWKVQRSLFENIAHMQHYGIPTRFLDYTTDIDIAAFFACADKDSYDYDGVIYICMYWERKIEHIDSIIAAELPLINNEITVEEFAKYIIKKYEIIKQYENVDELGIRILSWVDHGIMITPSKSERERIKKWNLRLYNQKGVFFVCGNKLKFPKMLRSTSYVKHHVILPEIADIPNTISHPDLIHKIIIRKEDKKEILKELEMKGINKTNLFP